MVRHIIALIGIGHLASKLEKTGFLLNIPVIKDRLRDHLNISNKKDFLGLPYMTFP